MIGRRALFAAPAALWLSACGFELRRAPELRFRTIQLVGFKPRSPLAEELTASINASTTTIVVESAGKAEVVLESLGDAREKSVVASTSAGQVREFQLRARFRFQLRTPAGKELIASSDILLTRDLSYTESVALAKEQEELFLYRAMQSDIVAQVLRRLSTLQSF